MARPGRRGHCGWSSEPVLSPDRLFDVLESSIASEPSELPRFIELQLAASVEQPPEGDEWLHEIKYDGYRILARREGPSVALLSRRGHDWTAKFPTVRRSVERLPAQRLLLDGEVAVLLSDGRTSFQALQHALGRPSAHLVYFVFDLLHLDGQDLRAAPLQARKDALEALLARAPEAGSIRFSGHVAGQGPEFFRQACRRGIEGIVSKRRDVPYQGGRGGAWLKVKCFARQELVIGGFTEPEGSRTGLGALLVGHYDSEGRLVFAGKVGTGFTHKTLVDLRRRLTPLEQRDCPFEVSAPTGVLRRNAHWVRPELVAEVAFFEWTEDGRLRHPSFQGLREDKAPREIRREAPLAAGAPLPATAKAARRRPGAVVRSPVHPSTQTAPEEVAGQRLTHPDRVLYPHPALTKLALARYYERISSWMLPHVQGRPLTLVRCPQGVNGHCFFMKHSGVWSPPALQKVQIQEKTKVGDYLVVRDLSGLIALVQMDVLEIHTWNARIEQIELPDRLVFDLDPGPRVPFREVVEAARLVRGALARLKLESFVKTTGGRGLHVVVPLAPIDWARGLAFSRVVAEFIAAENPRRYTTALAKSGREDKILIDYLRNNRAHTAVATYSTRARPGAPVSVPIAWDELGPKLWSDRYTVVNLPRRLAAQREDPWPRFFSLRQRIDPALLGATPG
jgi:bifunctional non-homologous end joining protein LigD